jgi:hypothetical protein
MLGSRLGICEVFVDTDPHDKFDVAAKHSGKIGGAMPEQRSELAHVCDQSASLAVLVAQNAVHLVGRGVHLT